MAVTIRGLLAQILTVSETFSGTEIGSSSAKLSFNGLNTSATITGLARAGGNIPLALGVATVDLTNLIGLGTNGVTVNALNMKLLAGLFKAAATNAGVLTMVQGAANPYLLAGSAWKLGLAAGQSWLFFGNAATPVISNAAKKIDLSGTGTDSLNVELIFG